MATKKKAERAKPTEIHSQWRQLIDKLQYSSQEFYTKVEKALEERQIPDLKISRVNWPEGGWLSHGREYLRITRERMVFDVCGAPFGTGFFFSIWFGEKPLRLGFLAICFLCVAAMGTFDLLVRPDFGVYALARSIFGLDGNDTTMLIFAVLALLLIGIAIRAGSNLDMFLMGLPLVGFVYERYFRTITYYRIDKMHMYQQAVHTAVMEVIDEITTLKCIKPLSEFERRPVMRDFFDRAGAHGRN